MSATPDTRPTLFVVAVNKLDLESTFVRPHYERMPARTVPIHGYIPMIGSRPILSDGLAPRVVRKVSRMARRQSWNEEIDAAYQQAFSVPGPKAVLAEFGPTAVRLVEPCRRAGVPLIAHFHGYDASVHAVIQEHRQTYPKVFEYASAIIGVSHAMCRQLVRLGAPAEKVHYSPYGVDCEKFRPADAALTPKSVLAVGRLVEKKAPHLTILAFAEVLRRHPDARLRIIGDGPLYGPCVDLVTGLGISSSVTFLGALSHGAIMEAMRQARCFVQHSLEAVNGDCEGTPNTIIEAGASGLPVVSTRHAGIPDVVIEGETGFLVDERDVATMAHHIARLLDDAELAGQMGRAARQHICSELPIDKRLAHLWSIIDGAIGRRPMPQATFAAPALQPALHS